MALRAWFLQAISGQALVEHVSVESEDGDGGFPKKNKLRVVGAMREVEIKNEGENSKGEASKYTGFQMPLHYPRYKKDEYERMEEWKVDMLLKEYGLACDGSLEEKRAFAIGAFLWPDQYY